MSTRAVLLAIGIAGVLGAGLWLGRASSAEPSPSAASTPARSASIPVAAVAPARTELPPGLPVHRADPTLAADLVDGDPKVRRAAIREAARDANVDVQLLLDTSRDSDLEVSAVATVALGDAYAHGRVPFAELAARAQDTGIHEKVRNAALNGLGAVASPEAAALLDRLASGGSTTERAAAATLLQNQDPELAIPALIRTLGDADAHVRECARDSLKARSRGRDFGEDAAAWRAWWTSRR